jgi:SPP1 gp7 family putative phage head morphogenesis protein
MSYDDGIADAIDARIAAVQRELQAEYKAAAIKIKTIMAEYYERYSQDGKLSMADMARYNRLSNLQAQIDDELRKLGIRTSRMINKLAEECYQASYYQHGYALEMDNMINLRFGLLNPETITAAVQEPVSGIALNEILSNHRYDVLLNERKAITQGLIMGESYPQMAKRIAEAVGTSLSRALVIARTEGGRNYTMGQLAAYERAADKGVDIMLVWSTSIDGRERPEHRAMHGKKADSEGFFHYQKIKTRGPRLSGVAGFDINCRCRVRGQVKGFPPTVTRINGEVVPFKDWKKRLK